MEDYQERVVEEKKELDEKLAKLRAFQLSEKFDDLDNADQYLLNKQANYMDDYSYILGQRIVRFK